MTIQHRPSSLRYEEAAQASVPAPQPPEAAAPEAGFTLPTPGPEADYDYVHHILIGSAASVQEAINRLHVGYRIERHRWTPPIPIREEGIHITPAEGQILRYLVHQQPRP